MSFEIRSFVRRSLHIAPRNTFIRLFVQYQSVQNFEIQLCSSLQIVIVERRCSLEELLLVIFQKRLGDFYGDLVYKFRKIIGKNDFPYHFKKIIVRYKKIGYNIDVL